MTIQHVTNPVNDQEIVVVSGTVDGIFFKEIPGGVDKYGNNYHGSVRIDGDYVNGINLKVNEGYDPQIRFNAGNRASPDWQTLERGDKVKMVVTESEYNGKTYYYGKVSQITLLAKGEGEPHRPAATTKSGSSASKGTPSAKRDFTGVSVGHSINVAFNLLGEEATDTELLVLTAKQAYLLTEALRKEYKEKHPNISDYDLGASVGQAVLSASLIVNSLEDIHDVAMNTLTNVVPNVEQFVRSGATSISEEDISEEQEEIPAKKPANQGLKNKGGSTQNASTTVVTKRSALAKRTKPPVDYDPDDEKFDDDTPF